MAHAAPAARVCCADGVTGPPSPNPRFHLNMSRVLCLRHRRFPPRVYVFCDVLSPLSCAPWRGKRHWCLACAWPARSHRPPPPPCPPPRGQSSIFKTWAARPAHRPLPLPCNWAIEPPTLPPSHTCLTVPPAQERNGCSYPLAAARLALETTVASGACL